MKRWGGGRFSEARGAEEIQNGAPFFLLGLSRARPD